MKRSKGFSMIELMIVISIINILASVAISIYTDYTYKARISETPPILKALAKAMIEYAEEKKATGECNTNKNGKCINYYPKKISYLDFKTNHGSTFGQFFEYKVQFRPDCGVKRFNRFAYAMPIIRTELPDDYRYVCMDDKFTIYHNDTAKK